MTDSSRSYYPASGVRGGYDNYPDPHRPVSTLLSGGRRARCDPGARQDGGQFRQVRYNDTHVEFQMKMMFLGSKQNQAEEPVHQEAGDCQQSARV